MWSNSIWNLLLLVIWMMFAGLIWITYSWTDSLIKLVENNDSTVFWTSSYEGMVYYVDVEWNEYKLVWSDIEVFCKDVLDK